MNVTAIDHFVLTVMDPVATVAFYHDKLGLPVERFEDGRTAIRISATQKINLQLRDHPYLPIADQPTFGSGDFCLMTDQTPAQLTDWLQTHHVETEVGPVIRHGARGTMTSFYLRDPDANLVEISALEAV